VLSFLGAGHEARVAIGFAMLIRMAMVVWESSHEVPRAVRTMLRLLPWAPEVTMLNLVIAMVASVVAMFTNGPISTLAAAAVLGSTFAASLMERYSFFAACPAPRMPGGVSA